ncbi:MAG: hypothetical protein WA101_02850 [Minisyncoccia bacterium]
MLSNILDRISFWSLFVVVVLLPVFFLPFTKIPIETSKGLLLIAGLVISIIFWAAARFSDGKIIFPKSWLLFSGFGIVLVFLISALFSATQKVSFFGIMFDMGTFYFILSAFLLMLTSSVILKDVKKAKMVLWGTIISSVALFVFQMLHLLMPHTLSLGILNGNIDNLLGSWNAFGIFAGLLVIISLFVIEFFSISKMMKIFLGILMALSVFLIIAVNFSVLWCVLGIFALFIFIYKVSFSLTGQQSQKNKRTFPAISFAVVMISLLFLMAGQFIGGFIPNRLNISNIEIRPSFSSTMAVTKDALAKDPILGAGPNRFMQVWDMYKPSVINSTRFWDASFNTGSGLLPTFFIMTGSLGILAWILFFAFLLISGFKTLFIMQKKNMTNLETILFFIMSLYLFVFSFVYPIGLALFLLAFAFLGIFIGLYSVNKEKGEITFSLLDDPRKSFFSILLLVVVMVIAASAGFKYVERFASISYFQKTLSAQTIPDAEAAINKAIALYPNDLYFRTYAQVYIAKLNSLAVKGQSITDGEKAELQASFDQALSGAQMAISYDQTNYLNYKILGSIYDVIAPLGAAGAYDKAIEAYNKALSLNPLNPGLKFSIANSYLLDGKIKEAKDYVIQTLTLKRDYIDALIMLSQISKNEGNSKDALLYAEAALSIFPQSQDLSRYVDSLKENTSVLDSSKKTTKDSKKENNN